MGRKSNELSAFKTPEGKAHYMTAYDALLTRWPVACQELNIPTRFGVTHILASGPPEAPPLVLLHCMLGSATVWHPNVAELSRHYRTYAVDVIGEPNKSVPLRPVKSREEFAQWLLDVFDALHVDQACVVGNSFGGFLAMNQASHTAERVKGVVLISPAATIAPIWPFYIHMFPPIMLGISSLYGPMMEWISQGLAIDEHWKDVFLMAILHGKPVNMVFPVVFGKEELRRIHIPTLLLIGDKEVIYKPAVAIRRAKRLMPEIQAEIIPGANHIAAMTRPEYVNERIIRFLQAV